MSAAALVPSVTCAQALDGERPSDGPQAVTLAPIYEGGLRKNRGINIPANLNPAPVRRLAAGYTASNSYTNPGILSCKDFGCGLEYESDHIGNLYFMSFAQPFLDHYEIALTVSSYRMDEPAALALPHRFVGDGVLRVFHETLLGEDSLPALSGAPDDHQVFAMTDLESRSLTLEPQHAYALPLRVDLWRYLGLKRSERARIDLNAGLHLAYPLDEDAAPGHGEAAVSRGLDLGLSVNLIGVRQVSDRVAATFHLQLARFKTDVHVVNPRSPLNADDDMRSQYALSYGLRFAGTFAGNAPCSLVLSHLSSSAQYEKDTHFAYDPVVFEGGNNLRGALAGANDYGQISFGCEHERRHYQLSLVEDIAGLSQLVGDDGAGTSYDPDLAVGFSATWVLDRRR